MRSRGALISSFWVALILSTSSSSLGHFNSDGIVLLEFKDSIFDPSGILSRWNLEYHHCSWEGVSCDAKSSVRSLRITGGGGFRGNPSTLSKFGISRSDLLSFHAQRSSRNINGTLVGKLSSTLFLLAELRVLSLPFHELSGEIPVEIRNLRKLEIIDLEGNSLSGRLPAAIFCSRNLRVLNLAGNQIHGNVPLNLWKLSKNCLQGPTPFLMFRPKNLHYFFLNEDSFTESSSSSIQASSKCSGKRRTLLSYQEEEEEEEEMEEDEAKKTMATVDDDGKNTVSVFDGDGKKTRLSSIAITSIISSSIIVSLLILLAFLFVYTRKMTSKSRSQFSGPKEITMFSETGVPLTFDTVVRATGNFSTSFCIGHGGFGSTYKVEISEGVFLAVKRLSVGKFPQGVKQFHAEIETLGRTRHENLVTLVGYHASRTEMFLIYNHLSGGNLERFIEERQATRATPKILRKIALGVARAVSFLHYDCVPRILHRDIKPSNVLLDAELNAYLSDFGLSRLLRNSETHVTTGVAGTFGYVAPEYATTCRVSYKSDVYSYGVVLLELISNKKLLDPSFSSKGNGFNIVSWARVLSRDGCAEDAFPPWLWLIGSRDWLVAALNLAIACTAENLVARPTMKQVVHILKDIQCADDDETLP